MKAKLTAHLCLSACLALTGCGLPITGTDNPACERLGSAAASKALGQKVKAQKGDTEGFFESCAYYPDKGGKALAVLQLYQDEAQNRFDEDRRFAQDQSSFREENLANLPAFSVINSDLAEAYGLDGSSYLVVWVFKDRFGASPEDARAAAVRLLDHGSQG